MDLACLGQGPSSVFMAGIYKLSVNDLLSHGLMGGGGVGGAIKISGLPVDSRVVVLVVVWGVLEK